MLGLYRILIWTDIRPLFCRLPDIRLNSEYRTLKKKYSSTKPTNISGRYFTLMLYLVKSFWKLCSFKVRNVCSTIKRISGFPASWISGKWNRISSRIPDILKRPDIRYSPNVCTLYNVYDGIFNRYLCKLMMTLLSINVTRRIYKVWSRGLTSYPSSLHKLC